jgi:hypothetical protein
MFTPLVRFAFFVGARAAFKAEWLVGSGMQATTHTRTDRWLLVGAYFFVGVVCRELLLSHATYELKVCCCCARF